MLALIVFAALLGSLEAQRSVIHHNKCGHEIWIAPLTNANGPVLGGGVQHIPAGGSHTYNIPEGGWAGRFWPKQGCNGQGQECNVGQSMPPCGAGGCDPPAETKVEFNFPPHGNGAEVWYDVSLVDGYSLSAEIKPSVIQGSCKTTRCAVSLNACPTDENNVGNLRINKNGNIVECLSPCKKWNFPPPHGLGHSEQEATGLNYCCPTPPVSPQQCRAGPVIHTKYVNLIHKDCPTAYSYAYDDEAGLHNCPNNVHFDVTWCI